MQTRALVSANFALPWVISYFKLDLILIGLISVLDRLCFFIKPDFMQTGTFNNEMYVLSAPSLSYSDSGLFQNLTSSR